MSNTRRKSSNELPPFRKIMGRLVEDSLLLPLALPTLWSGADMIPLDVYEEGDNLVIKASLPGIKPENLNIEVRENILTISGEANEEVERKSKGYLLNERSYGKFSRSVALPYEIKVNKVEADFEDGILTLTLPKAESTKTRKITLKTKEKAVKPEVKVEK
jgi:HSP20 family protein